VENPCSFFMCAKYGAILTGVSPDTGICRQV